MKHKIRLVQKNFKGSIQGWNIFKALEKWKELTFLKNLDLKKKNNNNNKTTQPKPQIETTTHLAIFKLLLEN